jgi:hypothetical protein
MMAQKEASHPLFYRVGSRRVRRRVVVAMYAGWLLIAAIVLVWSLNSRMWFSAMMLLVLTTSLVQLIWFVWLGRTYVNAPRLPDAELDERLLQVKNQAYRRAYLIVAPVTVLAWILSLAALQWQPNDEGKIMAIALVVADGLVVGTLPTTIVAWQEPDPEPLGS